MKYKYGKQYFDQVSREMKYIPRIYTDFYCSLKEWLNLGRGKENFMYQLRSKIVEDGLMGDCNGCERSKSENGLNLYKISFNRTGRRDGLNSEIYSANIVKNVIKYITHKDADVEFYSWKGTIDHIEISFGNCEMPNIIVLIDSYSNSSTNRTLIHCIDAIYKTLRNKASFYYEQYHKQHYNKDWDKIFNYSEDNLCYDKSQYQWYDTYRMKSDRRYNHSTIYYNILK